MTTLGILASGRGSNATAILQAIASGDLAARVGLLVSDDSPAPALALGERLGVRTRYLDPGRPGARLTPQAEDQYVQAMQDAGVELLVLAGFMRILGPGLLAAFEGRILNIHPSLLPAFPGLQAQRQALDHGVKITGCTVHFVDAGVDTGPIVAQAAVPVHDDDSEESLAARVLEAEHRLYPEALRRVLSGVHRDGRRVLTTPRRS